MLDPKIAEHKGRLVKTTGDGLLVEFGSVVDALRCADEVQRDTGGHNTGVPPDSRIEPDASFLRNPEHRELLLSGLRLAAGEA